MPQKLRRAEAIAALKSLTGSGLSSKLSVAVPQVTKKHPPVKEDLEWEWIYQSDIDEQEHADSNVSNPRKRKASAAFRDFASKRIVGARRGGFEIYIGDTVGLKAERNETWVALVTEFVEDEDINGDKNANFLWFASPHDIRDSTRRKQNVFPNEIYITPASDENPLDTIQGPVRVLSPQKLREQYPERKLPRSEHNQLFVCRIGCNMRTASYTNEFVWEEIYKGPEDIDALKTKLRAETKASRKRTNKEQITQSDGMIDFFIEEDANVGSESVLRTPKKQQRYGGPRTPRSVDKFCTPRSTLATPTSRRIVTKKPLEFTPLGTRVLSVTTHPHLNAPSSIARAQLHVSSVPAALPCREAEFSEIYSTLDAAITSATGTCVYISGTPGTGKTATVREVIAQLQAAVRHEELDDFIFVEINGMKVTDPHQSYSLLWEALMQERIAPSQAVRLLEHEFARPSPRRVPCVVLMDELDQLVTKNQEVMYNFFNWPTLQHSRLIVLAVANTMDLPERTLSNKISSRLGLTRITFQGYSHQQLMTIIESRLQNVPGTVIEPDAIQFASRKVAQVSGDARRALDICRRAVELSEVSTFAGSAFDNQTSEELPPTPSKTGRTNSTIKTQPKHIHVTIQTIQRAIREFTTSPLSQFLKTLPLSSRLYLAALLARTRRTGISEATNGAIHDEAKRIASMSDVQGLREWLVVSGQGAMAVAKSAQTEPSAGIAQPKLHDPSIASMRLLGLGSAMAVLLETGIIVAEARKGERGAKLRLQIGEDEVRAALKDDAESKGLGFNN